MMCFRDEFFVPDCWRKKHLNSIIRSNWCMRPFAPQGDKQESLWFLLCWGTKHLFYHREEDSTLRPFVPQGDKQRVFIFFVMLTKEASHTFIIKIHFETLRTSGWQKGVVMVFVMLRHEASFTIVSKSRLWTPLLNSITNRTRERRNKILIAALQLST